jgi:hypothetical protein
VRFLGDNLAGEQEFYPNVRVWLCRNADQRDKFAWKIVEANQITEPGEVCFSIPGKPCVPLPRECVSLEVPRYKNIENLMLFQKTEYQVIDGRQQIVLVGRPMFGLDDSVVGGVHYQGRSLDNKERRIVVEATRGPIKPLPPGPDEDDLIPDPDTTDTTSGSSLLAWGALAFAGMALFRFLR